MPAPLRTSDQGSASWKQERAGSVTGSKVAACMSYLKTSKESAARRDYRLQLVCERLTGIPNEMRFKPPSMIRGTDLEGEARVVYEREHQCLVEQVGFVNHPEIDWCGVSSDGLVGEDGCVEIKCPDNSGIHLTNLLKGGPALYKALMGEDLSTTDLPIPAEYVPQVHMEMWVLERSWCDFVSYDPRFQDPRLRLHVYRVARDEAYIHRLELEVVKFLDEVEDAVSRLLIPGAAQPEALAV